MSFRKIGVLRWCLVLALASCLAACGGPARYVERSVPGGLAQVEMPAPGMSRVVFIRPGSFGFAIGINVFDGTKVVGHCRSNSYFQYDCSPGKHVFAAGKENFTFLEAELLPDRIYYIKVSPSMGMWTARTNLRSLYPGCKGAAWEDLPRWLANVTVTSLTPEMEKWEQENRQQILEKYNSWYEPWLKDPDRRKVLPQYGQGGPIKPQK